MQQAGVKAWLGGAPVRPGGSWHQLHNLKSGGSDPARVQRSLSLARALKLIVSSNRFITRLKHSS